MVAVSKVGSLDAKIASLGAAREDRFPLRRCWNVWVPAAAKMGDWTACDAQIEVDSGSGGLDELLEESNADSHQWIQRVADAAFCEMQAFARDRQSSMGAALFYNW